LERSQDIYQRVLNFISSDAVRGVVLNATALFTFSKRMFKRRKKVMSTTPSPTPTEETLLAGLPEGTPQSVIDSIKRQFQKNANTVTPAQIASVEAPEVASSASPLAVTASVTTAIAPSSVTPSATASSPTSTSTTTVTVTPHENFFQEVGHDIKVGVEDAVKGVEYVVTLGDKLIKVIGAIKQLSPQFKTDLTTLINDAKNVATDVAPALASDGTNVTADMTAVTTALPAIIQLVKDVVAFMPLVEQAWQTIESDVS
jgi:hypothetical protein